MICPPCRKALKKRRGRHRAHGCAGGGVVGTMGYACDCVCQQYALRLIERRGGFPSLMDFIG